LGRDDESSTAYYAYVDGERYVLSKKAPIIEGGWSEGLRDNRGEYSAIILYNLIYNYTV